MQQNYYINLLWRKFLINDNWIFQKYYFYISNFFYILIKLLLLYNNTDCVIYLGPNFSKFHETYTGLVQCLSVTATPPPHDREHSLHSDHSAQFPLIACGLELMSVHSPSKHHCKQTMTSFTIVLHVVAGSWSPLPHNVQMLTTCFTSIVATSTDV